MQLALGRPESADQGSPASDQAPAASVAPYWKICNFKGMRALHDEPAAALRAGTSGCRCLWWMHPQVQARAPCRRSLSGRRCGAAAGSRWLAHADMGEASALTILCRALKHAAQECTFHPIWST